ncbi:uncharacterized protein PSFLO_01741 [Pseudozyma flocculosa]|uniref:Uncharacterized protein n=1 Tax=Pseudozyma flocculosa TaxID=84751 RepID=A0A5C3EWN3_9BASI|nr:uncharacterized protein PSFLO_01741 [Pseudozyma flocculosa]
MAANSRLSSIQNHLSGQGGVSHAAMDPTAPAIGSLPIEVRVLAPGGRHTGDGQPGQPAQSMSRRRPWPGQFAETDVGAADRPLCTHPRGWVWGLPVCWAAWLARGWLLLAHGQAGQLTPSS